MKKYKIRKLTEKECFRLMGVDDERIDKIQQSNISGSQQYKMAGNSSVVDVLYYVMRNIFVEQTPKKEKEKFTDLLKGL